MISSRSLDDLHPIVKEKALHHTALCKANGIDLLIYCTYRDIEAQNSLYAQGRTTPGNIVTNARGGESFHNYKLAYDCVPLVSGKPAWADRDKYNLIGILGESCGLEWAGRWTGKLREIAHFQYSAGLSLADLRSGKQIPAA